MVHQSLFVVGTVHSHGVQGKHLLVESETDSISMLDVS